MKYLCLVYQEESSDDALPNEAGSAVAGEVFDQCDELLQSGQLIVSSLLQSAQATITVRRRNGRVSVTDGPIAKTKDQLAGFYLIEAKDLNDAIRVASKLPSDRHGCIEIRPLRELRESLRPRSI
jgi:hypothetical protein